jgi:hypothetical protein
MKPKQAMTAKSELVARIATEWDRADEAQAASDAAREAWRENHQKAEEAYRKVGLMLIALREEVGPGKWLSTLASIGRSQQRANELMRLAGHRTNLEELRAATRARVATHRQRAKAAPLQPERNSAEQFAAAFHSAATGAMPPFDRWRLRFGPEWRDLLTPQMRQIAKTVARAWLRVAMGGDDDGGDEVERSIVAPVVEHDATLH